MDVAHYVFIWRLHGMAFRLVDAVLFLNIRALLIAIVECMKGYIKLRIALGTLHGALPDSTSEELQAYDDECAICWEPMAKAKKLSCSHLFHLVCLRSRLDQGLNKNYSCPTCRKLFFVSRPENRVTSRATVFSTDELLARHQISVGLDRPDFPVHGMHSGVIPNPLQNAESGDWRRRRRGFQLVELRRSWPIWIGLSSKVMRQLAAVGETCAQTSLEDIQARHRLCKMCI